MMLFLEGLAEGRCPFLTYQWGKPQPTCMLFAGGNAEGERIPHG